MTHKGWCVVKHQTNKQTCSVKASTFDFFIRLPVMENGGTNFFFGLWTTVVIVLSSLFYIVLWGTYSSISHNYHRRLWRACSSGWTSKHIDCRQLMNSCSRVVWLESSRCNFRPSRNWACRLVTFFMIYCSWSQLVWGQRFVIVWIYSRFWILR